MKRIGTVTIGQSPRADVIPEIAAILGPKVEIVEAGALDGLDAEAVAALAPRKGDDVLVTRLADGTQVFLAKKGVVPLLGARIDEHFRNGVFAVLLLCTGEFSKSGDVGKGFLIEPQKILFNAVAAVARGKRLGVFTPSEAQTRQAEARWGRLSKNVRAVAASPYVEPLKAVEEAAMTLKEWDADLCIFDCIGYSCAMQEKARDVLGRPAMLGRSIAARTLAELMA